MSDVGKVDSSKLGGPGPSGPKRKKGSDAEKFKEIMKEGKVRETDPEQQRQRKSKAEAEEETAADQIVNADQQVSGQEIQQDTSTPFELKFGREAMVSGEASSFEPEETPAPPPPMYQPSTPPIEEPEDYPIYEPSLGSPQSPSYPDQRTQDQQQPTSQSQAPREGEKVKQAPSKKVEKGKHAAPPVHHAPKKGKPQHVKPPHAKPIEPKEPTPYTPPQPLHPGKATKKVEITPEEEQEVPPPLAKGSWEATEALEKDEGKPTKKVAPIKAEIPSGTLYQQQSPLPPAAPGETPAPLAAPFAHLPPQIANMFERMVGVMTVMTTSGIKETTLSLDNPKFADSAFFGAKIIITEYSTAPKAFNIQLLGNDKAVTLFANNAQELVAAFEAGNYTFKVNRIDTGYLPPTQEVKRKEVRRVKRKRES